MSYGNELLEDYAFERDYPFGLPGKVWRSSHGDVALKDMTDSHIRNCMRIVGEEMHGTGGSLRN